MRLIASASSTRQDGSHPLIRLPEARQEALRSPPEMTYRPSTGPATLDIGAEPDSTVARQQSARPNSRRSIGGAAIRVPRPEPPAASVRPPVAVNQLALPDDQAACSRLPPKARRTSSVSMLSGRGPSSSGAARDQADQPAARRPSALGGSIRERVLLKTADPAWPYVIAAAAVAAEASAINPWLQAERAPCSAMGRASACSLQAKVAKP